MGRALPLWAGGLLIAAGVYQFTPLKLACLNKCRRPLAFLMSEDHPIKWKDVDQDPVKVAKLAALKDELLQGICAFFSSPAASRRHASGPAR